MHAMEQHSIEEYKPHSDTYTKELPRGVSVILYRNGCFAMSRRIGKTGQLGLWQFPGGHVEPGEAPDMAAYRELVEETGLNISIRRFALIGVAGPLRGYKNEQYMGYRYGIVLRPEEEPRQTESDKATPWEWVPVARLLSLDTLQATKEYALLFVYSLAVQQLRTHGGIGPGGATLDDNPFVQT